MTLGITHVVAVLFAFVMHRRFVFVFGVWGHVLRDLVRFESVYLTALGINAVALPVLVELGLHRIPARTDLLMVTEFGCDIIDYVHRAGSEPKVSPMARSFGRLRSTRGRECLPKNRFGEHRQSAVQRRIRH